MLVAHYKASIQMDTYSHGCNLIESDVDLAILVRLCRRSDHMSVDRPSRTDLASFDKELDPRLWIGNRKISHADDQRMWCCSRSKEDSDRARGPKIERACRFSLEQWRDLSIRSFLVATSGNIFLLYGRQVPGMWVGRPGVWRINNNAMNLSIRRSRSSQNRYLFKMIRINRIRLR